MKKYDYVEVVKNIYNLFNNSFGTDYIIKYQSRENIESLNPDIKVGKKLEKVLEDFMTLKVNQSISFQML